MHTDSFQVKTDARDQFVDITRQVQAVVDDANVAAGHTIIYVPHTTAGVTINENADPDVVHDMIRQLDAMVPWKQPFYRHGEGNSAAHVKASMMGSSVVIMIFGGKLVLGQWQGLYLCEFDGPRTRQVDVAVISA